MGGVPTERIDEVMGRIASGISRQPARRGPHHLARLNEGRPRDHRDRPRQARRQHLLTSSPSDRSDSPASTARTPPMTLIVPADRDHASRRCSRTPKPVGIAHWFGGDAAIVELRDHGPGIDETDRGRVFVPRGHPPNRKSGGSGLNLAIVSASSQPRSPRQRRRPRRHIELPAAAKKG